jgi:hypothetical protein
MASWREGQTKERKEDDKEEDSEEGQQLLIGYEAESRMTSM